jgi:uncharacterized protein
MKNFVLFVPNTVPIEKTDPPPERVIGAAPHFETQNFYTSGDGKKYSGIWSASVGKWAVSFTEWEYCHIMSGSAVITDEHGDKRTIKTGDSFVIEPGFAGTWDVLEPIRKLYVIFE